MMQGIHHHHHNHNQLAAFLTAALPKDSSSSKPSSTSPTDEDESSRLAAINSLHRAILYPPNSLLVTHSASFLAQGFSQLLADKSYSVRHAAATAYGALCAVLCSISMSSNGRQNHVLLGSLIDRFVGWSLPYLSNNDNQASELALGSLREFLNVGEVGAVERYALPILKACQELLEDERTSMSLLHRLLGLLTLISLKFFRCFQPHFVDIVDLLLGWAMVPDISEHDKRVIMDSFLQFQKHWVNNMQFSLGLLSKFLDDMDMLLKDVSPGTPEHFKRLLALLSCFCTVLQSVASGLLEINYLEQIVEPLSQMMPVLMGCLSMFGRKFGWSKWIEDSWRCLTLLAEILGDRFSVFYPMAVDILFQSLAVGNKNQVLEIQKLSSFQVHGVLKTNLQLLSLQKFGLMTSSVHKILQFDGPISQLRLHPNYLVTGSAAATYIFLLQHGKNDVVEKTMDSLTEELQLLKSKLEKSSAKGDNLEVMMASKLYSEFELVALIKFNLKVLLSCVASGGPGSLIWQAEIDSLYLHRVENLVKFLIERLNPFSFPITSSVDLQVTLLRTLERLSSVELLRKCSIKKQNIGKSSPEKSSEQHLREETLRNIYPTLVCAHLRRYSELLGRALVDSSPLAVKVEALIWMHKFCESVINIYTNIHDPFYPCQAIECGKIIQDLMFSTLVAASDPEPKVRALVATVLDALLKAKIIHPMRFPVIAEIILEKLGDPEADIKSSYLKLLSHVLPLTVYMCGLTDSGASSTCQPHIPASTDRCTLHWKQVFALKQLAQQLHSQQLVSVLSYISQRWKVPLSSWIQRLIHSCRRKKDHSLVQPDESELIDHNRLWLDIKVEEDFVERICSVNLIAGTWWAIHEAARFCIATRLRTNLGGPTQTFAALERMLRDIAHVLQLETEQSDGNLSIIGSHAHLLPMRLLLEFVESLKKNVYNAYEGSTVLVRAPRASSLFFRANKKVCEEWFSRISEPMMDAGIALQSHDATIHYCALRLHDFSYYVSSAMTDKSRGQVKENLHNIKGRYARDILRTVRNMSLALCKKRETEALVGLQKWATMAFSPLFPEENQGPVDDRNQSHFSWITGLVYQAGGHHEKAAAHFVHLLQSEESLTSMGSDGIQFIIARIIECYTSISDWKSLETWLIELQNIRGKYAGKGYSGALTATGNEINSIQALARFDEGDFTAAWSYLDLTPKSSSDLTLDPRLALQRSEQMLLQAMLLHAEGKAEKVPHELQKAKLMLEEGFSILPLDGLVEAAPHINQFYCISAFEEGCKVESSQGKSLQSLLGTYIQSIQFPCNHVHQDCSLWLKVLRVCQRTLPTSPLTLELCKNLMILARKQRNLLLASRLNNYLKDHASICSDESFRDYFIPTLEYENILLMRGENNHKGALTDLWSFVRPFMVSSLNPASGSQNSVLMAKACLKLSDWLQGDFPRNDVADVILEMQADFSRSEISPGGTEALTHFNDRSRVNHIIEELVGTSRKLSTRLCPLMGKAWILYASWCYAQARASISSNNKVALHSCSFSPILAAEIQAERFVLTEEEKLRVEHIILKLIPEGSVDLHEETRDSDISNTEFIPNDLKTLLQHIIDAIEIAAGVPGSDDCSSNSLSVALSSQLQKYLLSSMITLDEAKMTSVLGDLTDIWWALRKRRISLFGHAAQAFINYLSHSSSRGFGGPLTGLDVDPKYKYVNYTLRAMLYVLQILVNYGVELKDTLETALSKVPMLPWQEITPQLFAQLSSHPEKVVRKQLETLLVMLGKFSPWSLVYPTLVDANSPEKEPSEELQKILAYLNKLYPKLVQDVQLMIKELENVTVLWEELWLGTLQDLHPDVMRRINLLKEEAARIAANKTLSHGEKNKINAAKYSAMMAPIVVVLERRLASTSRRPETPHEVWFLEEYQGQIKSAVIKFKTPPASVAVLGDVWRPFETIAAALSSYQRKSSISVSEVAPQLALLLSSDAPMPGLEKQITISETESSTGSLNQEIVTIASFSEELAILPTKTKPKKLVIVGSDGLKYTYLLKGREDLRLDARIMQLLQAVNSFLQSSSSTHGQSLGIRYYSVTPISGRAGLIQWVDNVISIYSVFKSWQNRVKSSELSGPGADGNSAVPPIPRPSDMFYGKIIPALKEKGIRRVISRRDWPLDVKRKVLLDLMKETPKQLLHQELWCASEGFKAFSSKLKRYSGSVAAMSIVGHILGLGDRHLDNILIDFCSGDIVHIDYNVCFDKGQRLKIPEIVPFRLTQTIEAAFGLTGVEGTFRSNCEAVLGVLRKNKDTILMLLEVFVWDPLVEWTRANFHDDAAVVGEERKGMELAVSLSLFASRVQEIRVPLQEHHDLLLSTLPAVESAIEDFASTLNQYEIVSSHYFRADQERSNLVQHETSAKLVAAEATTNSEKSRVLFEMQAREFAQAQAMVIEKGREAAAWIEQHGRVLDALRNSSIPEIKSKVKLNGSEEALSLTSAVVGAGVPLTVVPEPTQIQCRDIDREVSHLVDELDHGLSSAVAALQMYSLALQRILPLNYLTTSPVYSWAQVLLSLNTLSPDLISAARRQGADLVTKGHLDGFEDIYDGLCLKVTKYAADIDRLEEEYTGLLVSIGPGTESKAKERLLSAFKKYMQRTSLRRADDFVVSGNHERTSGIKLIGETERNTESSLSILDTALSNLLSDVKQRLQKSLDLNAHEGNINSRSQSDLESFSSDFEEHVEKCLLVTEFANELKHDVGLCTYEAETDVTSSASVYQGSWASVFKASLQLPKNLVRKMTEVVIPSVIKSVLSCNSDVMDIFESISCIRGSLDSALEQLIQVELERVSLIELESNYSVKVGLITEKQLALGEASAYGRDHLSWEEAEELASQEEACRVQLDKLHQAWNQKDQRTSSLVEMEANINNTLTASEIQLQSLMNAEEEKESHVLRRKGLLEALMEPFSELESVDQKLVSFAGPDSYSSSRIPYFADLLNSGCSVSEYIWNFPGLARTRAFFIWKVSVMDLLLASCTHDVASSLDQKIGFDQLVDAVKRRLRNQLQDHIIKYMRDRVAPIMLTRLDREIEMLRHNVDSGGDIANNQCRTDCNDVRRLQLMLEEYCNAHETFRAARSAASIMKRQINELKDAFVDSSLETAQMEWMYNITTRSFEHSRLNSHKILQNDDNLFSVILNINRPKLLESMQSSVAKIARSLEGLQSCEGTFAKAETQLERAMSWACGGPAPSTSGSVSARTSGIPSEFHDHLIKRRKMLQEARENASDIMKVCISILEFEASRDGTLRSTVEMSAARPGIDGGVWQQTYLSSLTKLDVTYHSFTRAEHEWKLSQSNMEVASSSLVSATNELCIASVKAKSASGDLQSTLLAMKDSACEASVALSAYGGIIRGHSALTSECGSMLEEVLAITEDLADVHILGKEASALHISVMEELSKANAVLIPLDALLSKDVAAMADAMSREKEVNLEIAPIHGQAIFQSYHKRVEETLQVFRPLVPSLTSSVKGLHSMLIRLARAASLHAGNLHKALEGLGESLQVESQDVEPLRDNLSGPGADYDSQESEPEKYDGENNVDVISIDPNGLPISDRGWISPPESIASGSSDSEASNSEICVDLDTILPCSDGSNSQQNGDCLHSPPEKEDSDNVQVLIPPEKVDSNKEQVLTPPEKVDSNNGQVLTPPEKLDSNNKQVLTQIETVDSNNKQENSDVYSEHKEEASLLNQEKLEDESRKTPFTKTETGGQACGGKNAYAMSILRRVEMKIDGRDISDNREISVAEQVDYLLRQATNIDNLCNMYEGWTPWI